MECDFMNATKLVTRYFNGNIPGFVFPFQHISKIIVSAR